MYAKHMPLTLEQINEFISYDPLTGEFLWKKAPARRFRAGTEAGKFKSVGTTSGQTRRYKYIGLLGYQTPASRVAWMIVNGVWPKGNIFFKDDNTENLKWDNLEEGKFPSEVVIKNDRRYHIMSREAQRDSGLKRYYGLSLETYNVMLAAQNGVCDICKGTETYIPQKQTQPKPLSVDHNHATGQIRGILCSNCNYMIGHCKENRDVLLEAVKYLDKHSGAAATVTPLTVVSKTGD